MNIFQVKLNETTLTNDPNNEIIFDFAESQYTPQIKFDTPQNEYRTILMVDPDAPSRDNPVNAHWLHLLIINNGEIVAKYHPPSPPKGTGLHRYIFYLLKQKNILDKDKLNLKKIGGKIDRKKFDINKFISDNELEIIDKVYFQTERK